MKRVYRKLRGLHTTFCARRLIAHYVWFIETSGLLPVKWSKIPTNWLNEMHVRLAAVLVSRFGDVDILGDKGLYVYSDWLLSTGLRRGWDAEWAVERRIRIAYFIILFRVSFFITKEWPTTNLTIVCRCKTWRRCSDRRFFDRRTTNRKRRHLNRCSTVAPMRSLCRRQCFSRSSVSASRESLSDRSSIVQVTCSYIMPRIRMDMVDISSRST